MGYWCVGFGIMNVSGKNNDIMLLYENKLGINVCWYYDVDGKGCCVIMFVYWLDNDINIWDDDELILWVMNGFC